MSTDLEEARRHKLSARADDAAEEPEEALESLDKAIALLEPLLDRSGAGAPGILVAFELADCYGIKGGILRRMGGEARLAESLAMYDRAAAIESTPEYEVDSSYGLSNAICNRILLDANRLAEMRPRIDEAVRAVLEQTNRTRRNDWWAWADLGLFLLLQGDEAGALAAHMAFTEKGPQRPHFVSVIQSLHQLKGALERVGSPLVPSFKRVIEFLENKTPAS
jgi:tetratricopeptide (TPR) repeat protein